MPRILQALRNLQAQTLGPSAEADHVPSGAEAVPLEPEAQENQTPRGLPEPTIVLENPAPPQVKQPTAHQAQDRKPRQPDPPASPESEQAAPAASAEADTRPPNYPQPPSPLQNELIQKLTRQLAQALKQRDSVAKEVQQIRQTLESHDRQKEEEVVRLRHLLEGHEQSAKAIEAQLKQQLQRQQEEFARKLDDFEKRIHTAPVAAPALSATASPEATSAAASEPPPAAVRPSPRADRLPTSEVSLVPKASMADKPIPQTAPIRAALQELAIATRNEELSALAGQVFGTVDPAQLTEPLVVFLGSCHPGRSTEQTALQLALWFSQQAAAQEVLVIDGALREKTLSQQLGLRTSPGIFEAVRRENYRRDGLYRDADTGLAFMPAGRSSFLLTPNEQDALALREDLLELLKTWPVILIVGEGPELSTSRLFASLAMKTYLQVELGQVSAPEVFAAVEAYRQAGIEPAGLIATHTAAGCYT